MGVLERLRGWWRSVTGDDGDVETTVEGTGTYDYECSVCGTGVDEPDADCPLCRSSDVVAADARPPSATSTGGSTRGPDGVSVGGEFSPPGTGVGRDGRRTEDPPTAEFGRRRPVRRSVAPADDAAVERLRELRGAGDGGELLERHADRWEPHAEGFRVETAAGTRIVDSHEDVVALLRATDR